jgi:hypothetical protein
MRAGVVIEQIVRAEVAAKTADGVKIAANGAGGEAGGGQFVAIRLDRGGCDLEIIGDLAAVEKVAETATEI